jgi:S1-C subfamily serine protease
MDRSGSSFEFGEPFEDPEDLFEDLEGFRGEEEPNSCGSIGGIPEGMIGDESTLRGWIPPDDRLWLHPSEIGRDLRVEALVDARRRARRADRRGILAAGIVGTAALTAAVAAVALAASSPSQLVTNLPLTSSTTHLTSSDTSSITQSIHQVSAAQACFQLMSKSSCAAIERVQPSILPIVVGQSPETSAGTAVVVSTSAVTVAITAASLVGSATIVKATDPSGKVRSLKVIGVDKETGIAALGVPWKMPAAQTAQEPVFAGQFFPLLATDGPSSDFLHAEMDVVDTPSAPSSQLMDSFEVGITAAATPGGVLIDSRGAVIGVLSLTDHADSDVTGEFVPSWLAVGVAKRLAAHRRVVHGWLDVVGANGQDGAVVVEVPADGPAAIAGLKPGDLVVGITTPYGTEPIRSMDDLRGRLYLEPPGAKVDLEVMRGGQELVLDPVLAAALS